MHKSSKRTHRGLALVALAVFGIACWQASNWSNSAVHAAAISASRAALDAATARFKADPTTETAAQLQEARKHFARAAAADPANARSGAVQTMAPSALLQVEILQKMKSGLTMTQRKIGSRLMIAAGKQQGKLPLGLESLRTTVETSKGGDALVDLAVTSRIAGLKALDRYNFVIRSAVGKTIRAEVPFNKLEEIAALPAVIAIREPGKGFTSRFDPSSLPSGLVSALATNAGFEGRAVTASAQLRASLAKMSARSPRAMFVDNITEGDKTHRALDGRNAFGVNGTGVKIGVISDGVDSLAARQATGDLPPVVTVLPLQAGSGDEGTAMLEIVHDLAPGAELFFATANPDQAQFAQNIRDLRTAGCDIIVDDFLYFNESPLHDGQPTGLNSTLGIIAQAVNDVTAAGALFFSSAGNEGQASDLTSGTWEGDFNPSAAADPAPLAGANLHNFGDGGNSILVEFGGGHPPVLHWSDPLDTSSNDYDIYDMDGGLTTIFDASTDVQDGVGGDDQPVEISGPIFNGERLLIDKFSGSARFLSLRVLRGELDNALATSGSTHGHSSCANAFSVAATPVGPSFDGITANGPFPSPFTAANETESFSSDGPRQLFYKADGTLFGPGVLNGQGLIRQKPDITAADGVTVATPGFTPFYGTSAAAPHAAAIAALIKSANGSLTPAQIRTALTSSAIDIEAAGVDRNTGAGIVMAYQALQAAGAVGIANLELGTVTFSETGGDGDGFLEPCERLNFTIPLNNVGVVSATAVSATLSSTTPGVVINPALSAYPDIPGPGSANNSTPFTVTLPCTLACGSVVNFTLTVTYTGGPSPKLFNFSYLLGGPGTPITFSYIGPPVPIPDGLDLSGTAPGAPVMAPLLVSGLTQPIFDLNFRIDGSSCDTTAGSTTVGIDHTFVNDLEIKLISPATTTLLMIHNTDGSGNNFCQTLLDDETANPSIQTVVSANAPFTGTFKPNLPLSIFDGETGNGTWNLQAQDFFSSDIGNIRAFSLIITPTVCQTSPCVLTCPGNISMTSATSVTIDYAQPMLTGGCGVVTCSPASGSMFPVGMTTVTCTSQAGPNCQFTVTITAPCTITCPANITKSNDLNQCGSVTNYPAPTTTGACGTVTCSPASGSFFPKGTTTVTCTPTTGSSCTFTVTVNDTQPPSITCPTNITTKTPTVNDQCVVTTFLPPTASDNCPMVTAICNPPSGTCFPVGTTTVTCTATDMSGNTATCSFTVSVFNVCLQDDSNPSIVFLGNTITGAYRFCCGGTTYTGAAQVTKKGNVATFQHNPADRRVLATDDEGTFKGSASLQSPPGTTRCAIQDRDTRNNSCVCQ